MTEAVGAGLAGSLEFWPDLSAVLAVLAVASC